MRMRPVAWPIHGTPAWLRARPGQRHMGSWNADTRSTLISARSVDLLIIGAGPYGLAMAACAADLSIDHEIVGEPMGFWHRHMPAGMLLRSTCDWHLDPIAVDTIVEYTAGQERNRKDVEPLSRSFYLGYAAWFQRRKCIQPTAELVTRLDVTPDRRFHAVLSSGDEITARRVVVAVGFGAFPHVPASLAAILPEGRYGHTRDEVEFERFAGKRVLTIGGRQSAYEWAALLSEAGAAEVHVAHRHSRPAFAAADWSWAEPLVARMSTDSGWFRQLAPADQAAIVNRMYGEGRLKIEPWLESRVERDGIRIWSETTLASCAHAPAGAIEATLTSGHHLMVDHIILATGYKVQIDRLPFLRLGNILPILQTDAGFPVLDESFQSSVPGLYIVSMPATRDFGPFFGFTIAARASAQVIGAHLLPG